MVLAGVLLSTNKNKKSSFFYYDFIKLGQDIDGEAESDQSGLSVALSSDGKIVAIGAQFNDGNGLNSGHVRVYELSNNDMSWNQLGQNINGEAGGDESGYSVALSSDGKIVAIGALNNDDNGNNSGHVRVYELSNNDTSWYQLGQDIDGEVSYDDNSGFSVALSSNGKTVAIGAPFNDGNGNESGHVRVYELSNNDMSWVQLGGDIDGEASGDRSGWSVALSSDGKIVAIGALKNDDNGGNSGHVRVFEWIDTSWVQLGKDISGEAVNDQSGRSVSLSSDGTRVAIGAIGNDGNGNSSGHVRVYEYVNSSWTQLGKDIDGEAANDQSGRSVSLSSDGNTVAIGAIYNGGNGINSGHVRVFEYNNSLWSQLGEGIDGEAVDDWSGRSVSLSSDGTRVAIGANGNDGNGDKSGHVRVYDIVKLKQHIN